MIIRTKRLVLRPLKQSDAKSVADNINNLNVSRWLYRVPHPYSIKDAIQWIRSNQKKWLAKPIEDYVFGIDLKSEHKIIGGIGIHDVNRNNGSGEIGYWLGENYWGNGYGCEALKAVVDFALKRLKLRRLEAGVFDGNHSSGRLLEKVGFKHEGRRIKSKRCKADGKIHDEHVYGLLKSWYRAG